MSHKKSVIRHSAAWVFAVSLSVSAAAVAEQPKAELSISPELRELLRAEMKEVAGGMQSLVVALSAGDWRVARDTAAAIRASYIMTKSLTRAQRQELEQLPQAFKQLDAEFHQRADRLSEAASAHNAELSSFYLYRMVESCTACHAQFATKRFPGFAPDEPAAHHHH